MHDVGSMPEAVHTENQVRPHEGFRSDVVRPRANRAWRTEGSGAPVLAKPAHWTEGVTLPCVPTPEMTPKEARYHMDLWDPIRQDDTEAALLCRGCPRALECLEEALEEEGQVGHHYRHMIRGGLTPRGRAMLAGHPPD